MTEHLMKQINFSEAEYSAKRKVTRRERFLADLDAVVPWDALVSPSNRITLPVKGLDGLPSDLHGCCVLLATDTQ